MKPRYHDASLFLWRIHVLSSKRENGNILQLNHRMINHMRQYGYMPIDLPIIENADLFLIKAGDQIVNRLFTFEHHNQQLALRPEFTASAAYHYMIENRDKQPVVRWQFSGFIFEDDPNNPSQNHQRFSIGAELIGMDSLLGDTEIVNIAVQGLIQENINNWQLVLGHIGLLRSVLVNFNLDSRTERFLLSHLQALKHSDLGKAFVLDQLDKLLSGKLSADYFRNELDDPKLISEANTQQMLNILLDTTQRGITMGGRTRDDIARRLLQKRKRSTERQQIVSAIDFLMEWNQISARPDEAFKSISNLIKTNDVNSKTLLSQWKSIVETLEVYDIPIDRIKIQPDLARFWDYYTGMLFELRTSDNIQLGGGGRYDELSKLLGGKTNVPAVGFAYYVDQLMSLKSKTESAAHHDIVICVNTNTIPIAVRWSKQLRQYGSNVQILPETNLPEFPSRIVFANVDGTLRLNNNHYRLEDIDQLVSALK
jgi:histidyl-tRNA synthetase